jgi:hypothetical protein
MPDKKTTKIVYNACFGSFGLSERARQEYCKLSGVQLDEDVCELKRHDPYLVTVIEALGTTASSDIYACLKIEEIQCSRYRITEYDGFESIETPDDVDWIDVDEE